MSVRGPDPGVPCPKNWGAGVSAVGLVNLVLKSVCLILARKLHATRAKFK